MRIKVCGMTRADQVKQLDDMGVDFAGFIFYPKSPRYVFRHMSASHIKNIKGNINKVGVFVNEEVDEILRIVDECGLYIVQLHGDETPKFCERISDYITVIKVFRVSENENIEWKIKDYYEAADMFMFDTGPTLLQPKVESTSAVFGGTGRKFNWDILKGMHIRKPFFLSGGIAPDDVENIKTFTNPDVFGKVGSDLFAIDLNSKFEHYAGVKDMEKIRTFVDQVRDENL